VSSHDCGTPVGDDYQRARWDGCRRTLSMRAASKGGALLYYSVLMIAKLPAGEPRLRECDTFSYTRVVSAGAKQRAALIPGTGIHARGQPRRSRQYVGGRFSTCVTEEDRMQAACRLKQSDVGDRSRPLPCRRSFGRGLVRQTTPFGKGGREGPIVGIGYGISVNEHQRSGPHR